MKSFKEWADNRDKGYDLLGTFEPDHLQSALNNNSTNFVWQKFQELKEFLRRSSPQDQNNEKLLEQLRNSIIDFQNAYAQNHTGLMSFAAEKIKNLLPQIQRSIKLLPQIQKRI